MVLESVIMEDMERLRAHNYQMAEKNINSMIFCDIKKVHLP